VTDNWVDRLAQSTTGRRLLEQERVVMEATEALCDLMEQQGVSRSELARRLNISPAYITKMLRGTNNFTLRKLSDAFSALGQSLHVYYGPAGDELRVPDEATTTARLSLRGARWAERNRYPNPCRLQSGTKSLDITGDMLAA